MRTTGEGSESVHEELRSATTHFRQADQRMRALSVQLAAARYAIERPALSDRLHAVHAPGTGSGDGGWAWIDDIRHELDSRDRQEGHDDESIHDLLGTDLW